MILTRVPRLFNGEESSINDDGKTWKRMKLDPYFILSININSKWIKKLNIRPKIIKLIEKTRRKASWHGVWQ